MRKQFLILKTGSTISSLLEKGEDFEHWFIAGSGVPAKDFIVRHLHLAEPLPDLAAVQGIIITGSPAYVTDEAPWNFTGADYLRQAQQQNVPILGVCYGHQLVAWAFGGAVDFHPQGREIGTVEVRATAAARDDVLFGSLPASYPVQVSHQQTVTVLPPGAVRLAANTFEPNHAFRLGQQTWCVQFHPEFTPAISRAYIEQRAAAITAEGLDLAGLLAALSESREAASLLRLFAAYCQAR